MYNTNQYKLDVKRTLSDAENCNNKLHSLDLSHMTLGLTSEIGELLDAIDNKDSVNVGEEIGDMFWYLFNLSNMVEIDIDTDYKMDLDKLYFMNFLIKVNSEIANEVKRYLAYNKQYQKDKIKTLCNQLFFVLKYIANEYEHDHLTIMFKNINKLKVRYPEKFDEIKAIDRNLENELNELK